LIEMLEKAGASPGKMPDRPAIPARTITLDGTRDGALIVQAVQKSLDLLQLSSDTFLDVRANCVSCHHQNLPGVAIAWARDRGFRVRRTALDRMVERQIGSWAPRVERSYELDVPYPVPAQFLGYGMWMFAELGHRPDELTRAVSWYLAATQQPDGHWPAGMLRPPLGSEEIFSSTLAMRSLQLYPLPGREQETAERIARARSWLQRAEPRTHQQMIYRTLGLAWTGSEPEALTAETQTLLGLQRADGGWAQLPGLDSDAWATGESLVVLHIACGLPATHPAYRRGLEMLLRTQFDDGSWFVQTRSWPFQPYFESKFPYGRDQWISAPATAWAVMALVQAIEPAEVAKVAGTLRVPSAEPAGKQGLPDVADKPADKIPALLVPAATRTIDFATDIQPLFARSCLACHGEKDAESNFSLTSREALIRGGDSELPAIVPGASQDSQLVRFAAGLVADLEMPPLDAREKSPPLSRDELSLLRAWIDQGAKWSSGDKPDAQAKPRPMP
jgi:mono/diheme cytochrome c family protein